MESFVLNFSEIDNSFIPIVGGKGANLGELTKAGFNVPKGFCVTVNAYNFFVSKNRKLTTMIKKLELLELSEINKIAKLSEQIRNHIIELEIPEILQTSILESLNIIGASKCYAIRSSATTEDSPEATFAGQYDTFLNIKGTSNILQSIKLCFASLYSQRAVLYRKNNNFSNISVYISVIVQEMIFSEVSGIMFTADPISGSRKTVSINASFGLGEAIVSGLVKSDLYTVIGNRISKKDVSQKSLQIIALKEGGTVKNDIKQGKQISQALTDKQIVEFSKIGKKIEALYKSPQDIEWCFKDDVFYIVQTRPVTCLYPLPENIGDGLHLFLSLGHVQMMTEAIKPLGLSVFLGFSKFVENYFKVKNPFIYDIGNHIYIDLMRLLNYNIFKNNLPYILENVDETSSRILTEFYKNREFKKLKRKRISIKMSFKIIKFIYSELKLLFKGDLNNIYDELDRDIYYKLSVFRNELNETESNQKIAKIKEIINSIPLNIAETKILNYMPLAIGTYKILSKFSKKWLGDTNEIDAIGKAPEGNVTTEMGLVIGDIADIVNKHDHLKEYLETTDFVDFWKHVEKIKGGKEFSELFHQFLKKYGMRCTGEIDITHPRWSEEPMQVVSLILNNANNLEINQHRQDFILAREQGLETSKIFIDRVKKTSFGFLKSFLIKRLIYVYRSTIGIREHPKFFLINIFGIIRENLLEEANVLLKNKIITNIEDIYYFSLDEIEQIIETQTMDENLLKIRISTYESNSKLKPPRIFTGDGEILISKPTKITKKWAITGTPASSGIVEGRARVILKLEDADLQKGDIIVTTYTDPAWTTLFGIASAVVTEVGGLLTHGAVVAREYGIPAIVGVDNATTLITDGMMIRVNGNEGYIEILE